MEKPQQFEGFSPITPDLIYKNEMLYHARRQTELLEQIAQLLQPHKNVEKDDIDATPRQQRQHGGRRGKQQ